jgi:hypothetical protein
MQMEMKALQIEDTAAECFEDEAYDLVADHWAYDPVADHAPSLPKKATQVVEAYVEWSAPSVQTKW